VALIAAAAVFAAVFWVVWSAGMRIVRGLEKLERRRPR